MGVYKELTSQVTTVQVKGNKFHAGIGWEPFKGTARENFMAAVAEHINAVSDKSHDLNIAALIRHVDDSEELVFFGKKTDAEGSVRYLGDNRNGRKKGEDEAIDIEFARVPMTVKDIIFFTLIYQGLSKGISFKDIDGFFCQVKDAENDKSLYRNETDMGYEEAYDMTAYVFGKLDRDEDNWTFRSCHFFTEANTELEVQENIRSMPIY